MCVHVCIERLHWVFLFLQIFEQVLSELEPLCLAEQDFISKFFKLQQHPTITPPLAQVNLCLDIGNNWSERIMLLHFTLVAVLMCGGIWNWNIFSCLKTWYNTAITYCTPAYHSIIFIFYIIFYCVIFLFIYITFYSYILNFCTILCLMFSFTDPEN